MSELFLVHGPSGEKAALDFLGVPGVATMSGLRVGGSPKNLAGLGAIEARDHDQFQNESPVLFHVSAGAVTKGAVCLEDGVHHCRGFRVDHPQRIYDFPTARDARGQGPEAPRNSAARSPLNTMVGGL